MGRKVEISTGKLLCLTDGAERIDCEMTVAIRFRDFPGPYGLLFPCCFTLLRFRLQACLLQSAPLPSRLRMYLPPLPALSFPRARVLRFPLPQRLVSPGSYRQTGRLKQLLKPLFAP